MSDVITIATKRLETLKAEMTKIEQFLAFAAELQSADGGRPTTAAPARAPEARSSESAKSSDQEKSSDSDSGGFQLTRDHMVAPGGGLRDSARRANGS